MPLGSKFDLASSLSSITAAILNEFVFHTFGDAYILPSAAYCPYAEYVPAGSKLERIPVSPSPIFWNVNPVDEEEP